MLDGTHYFDCHCGSAEHTLRFVMNKEDNELYTEIYLNQWRQPWKRIWVAIKYIFGFKCRYGHWDCWTLDPEEVKRLRDMCNEFIENNNEKTNT